MKNFNDYCQDFIQNELPNFIDISVYGCDLYMTLCEEMSVNGSVTFDKQLAKEYMQAWYTEAGEYWEYEKYEYGEHFQNPFDNPEAYMVCMIMQGINSLLGQCGTLEKVWDETFCITSEFIENILTEVKKYKVWW